VYRRSTSQVTARMTSGASRHAGQGRLAATPNGMWCAARTDSSFQRSGSKTTGWS
jgi:hypothetical protein